MNWLRTILMGVQLLSWLVKQLDRQRNISEGESRVLLKHLNGVQDELQIALTARSRARNYADTHPDRVHDADPFQRPGDE